MEKNVNTSEYDKERHGICGVCIVHLEGKILENDIRKRESMIIVVPTNDVTKFNEELKDPLGKARKHLGIVFEDYKIVNIENLHGTNCLVTYPYTVQEKEFFTQKEITDEYLAFPIEKQLAITNSAIAYMQEYNGRSVFACKAMAMGYSNTEGETDTWTKNKK